MKTVFIIDELDRCRPDFAIKTLEIIKHYFDLDDIIFIISSNLEQLTESVKSIYGLGSNADIYLSKFYDYSLEIPNWSSNVSSLEIIHKDFYDFMLYNSETLQFAEEFMIRVLKLFEYFNLSIREQKKILKQFVLIMSKEPRIDNDQFIDVLVFLLIIKYSNIYLFNTLISGNLITNDDSIFHGISKIYRAGQVTGISSLGNLFTCLQNRRNEQFGISNAEYKICLRHDLKQISYNNSYKFLHNINSVQEYFFKKINLKV